MKYKFPVSHACDSQGRFEWMFDFTGGSGEQRLPLLFMVNRKCF